MNVPKTKYEIVYNGKNITGDILPFVLSFVYSDKSAGEADELELVLEDKLDLWKNEWFPTKGDTLSAKIIDVNGTLDCGVFTIDELSGEGSTDGDRFTIKALAAGINKKLRSKNSHAHENKNLREIATHIAAKHGLSVSGTIQDVRISRVTQYRETDLAFLKRLSFEYGYTFNIRDKQLIFTSVFELETKASALEIHRNEITGWNVSDKTAQTYSRAKIAYHNPKQKKVISHEQAETTDAFKTAKVDTLELKVKADNQQQAQLKTKVALYRANSLQQEGSIEMPGNIYAVAGNNITLVGLGVFSGLYYLETSSHNVDRDGGYVTTLNIKRVGMVDKAKQKQ